MNITLLKKEIKSNWLLLIIFLAVLTMYGVMVTMMYEPELGESLKMMAESMPEIFAAFGMAEVGETLLEFLSGYLYGMLFVAFPGVFIIILTNRLCAKYVDNGSMAYLLAGPGKRREIMRTQAIFMVGCLVLMVLYVFGLLAVTSKILFPGELDMAGFFCVNVGLLGILLFFGGAGFFVSCLSNESRHAVGFTSAVVVYTILVQMISQVGDKFENLKYITPVTLFDVEGLSLGEAKAWIMCAVLYLTGIALICAGIVKFNRRDLPL